MSLMEPYFKTPQISLYVGHCLSILSRLPDESVNCCITSPPYFNLRQYGTEPQEWGGDLDCDHDWTIERYYREGGASGGKAEASQPGGQKNASRIKTTRWKEDCRCSRCGAWKGELGQEQTPQEFVNHLVEIFAEVYRVLRKDGVAWVNMGDSYADKSLQLVPQRLAIALQDVGWIVRSEIIWSKKAPMPESVTDRCTRAHEQIWMLTKSARYWSDFGAIRQPAKDWGLRPNRDKGKSRSIPGQEPHTGLIDGNFADRGANCRDVWHLSPEPLTDVHYASYPAEIPRRCILSTCPLDGTVLDPFAGSGTTLLMAQELGRKVIGIELNPNYAAIAAKRCQQLTIFGAMA